MAEDIKLGTYRLVALTYNGTGPDKYGRVDASRLALIFRESPSIKSATYRLAALTTDTRNPDILAAVSGSRFTLVYADSPTISMATYRLAALTTDTRNPDRYGNISAGRMVFLITPPIGFVSSSRIAFLINQQETGPAAYAPQFVMKVQQQEDWPTVEDTFSTSSALQVFQSVVQQEVYGMPWSQTRVTSETMAVLQRAAFAFDQSPTVVLSNAMMALQSDLHEYNPVSMDYVLSQAMQVVQETPMQIWQSPHYVLSLAQWELYRTPMGFLPRSTTTAYHVSLKVLQETPMGYLPWSDTDVHQVAMKTLFDYISPIPDQGTNEVFQNTMLALQHTDGEPDAIGPEHVSQMAMQTLQEVDELPVQSRTRAMSLVEVVLQETFYDPPASIGKTSAMQSVLKVAIDDTDYQHPDIVQSQMPVGQTVMKALQQADDFQMWQSPSIVPQAHIEWLQGADYPPPGEMIPPTNAALLSQLGIRTVQKFDTVHPQSFTRALQMAQLTSQYLFYTPASDLATKGVFIGQTVEAVARVVSYPDPAEPISPAFADQITVMTAYTDDTFPDPTKEAQPGEAFQVVEVFASGADYPDPSVSQVQVEVYQAAVQCAAEDVFPDPAVPASAVTMTQISIQASADADYPDPVDLVSPAEVSQAVGQVSQVSVFPNPANPASTLTVNQTLQMVALPDVTLHGVPDYEIKHRPIITISIVYIQTS